MSLGSSAKAPDLYRHICTRQKGQAIAGQNYPEKSADSEAVVELEAAAGMG